ncbi:unnamed protein product, partial [Dovyalis caffra]
RSLPLSSKPNPAGGLGNRVVAWLHTFLEPKPEFESKPLPLFFLENTVGILTMSRKQVRVLATLTSGLGKIMSWMH